MVDTNLEFYERLIFLNCHCMQSMLVFDYVSEFLPIQEELYIIVLLLDPIFLVLPEVLVLGAMEKYRDILRMVVK